MFRLFSQTFLATQNLNSQVDGQTTLVGIVSGGLGCGNGIPNWYTRVSFYEEWIACIQEKSRELKTFVEVSLDKTSKKLGNKKQNLRSKQLARTPRSNYHFAPSFWNRTNCLGTSRRWVLVGRRNKIRDNNNDNTTILLVLEDMISMSK